MDMETNGLGGGRTTTDIRDAAIAISVELRCPGVRRKLKTGEVEIRKHGNERTADNDETLGVSKEILESPAYEAIKRLDGDIRRYLESRSVRAKSLFRDSVVFVRADRTVETDEALKQYGERRQELVNAFVDGDYDQAIMRARRKLEPLGLFNEDDYPTAGKLREAFGMKVNYPEFGTVSANLKTVSSEIFRRQMAESEAAIAAATVEMRDVLRGQALELSNHLVERLTPTADGKAKVFRDSAVENVREFLETFNARNITNDQELEASVARMRALLDGVDPQTLRDSTRFRDQVRQNVTAIKAEFETLLADRPTRALADD